MAKEPSVSLQFTFPSCIDAKALLMSTEVFQSSSEYINYGEAEILESQDRLDRSRQ